MTATTATQDRYFATRFAGRYRVFDRLAADEATSEVAICASKAKAQEKADRLNALEAQDAADAARAQRDADHAAVVAQQEEDARVAAIAAQAAEDAKVAEAIATAVTAQEDALTEAINRGDEAGADNARAELLAMCEADAAMEAEMDVTCPQEDATPAARPVEKMAAAVAAKKAAKAEDTTVAYRIGKVLREFVLTQVTPADSALVAHITGRNVCYDGTATLRLTAAWAEELSGAATALENAALSGAVPAKAPAVMAARAAHKGLAKLF